MPRDLNCAAWYGLLGVRLESKGEGVYDCVLMSRIKTWCAWVSCHVAEHVQQHRCSIALHYEGYDR